MKKVMSLLLVFVMLIIPFMASADDLTLILNGKKVNCDAPPVIVNSRTLVPVRVITENLDCQVSWYAATSEVEITDAFQNSIILTIGSTKVLSNFGLEYTLDVAPEIMNSRTYVPLRFIAELFDCTVDWDETARAVYIDATPIEDTSTDNTTQQNTQSVQNDETLFLQEVLKLQDYYFPKLDAYYEEAEEILEREFDYDPEEDEALQKAQSDSLKLARQDAYNQGRGNTSWSDYQTQKVADDLVYQYEEKAYREFNETKRSDYNYVMDMIDKTKKTYNNEVKDLAQEYNIRNYSDYLIK